MDTVLTNEGIVSENEFNKNIFEKYFPQLKIYAEELSGAAGKLEKYLKENDLYKVKDMDVFVDVKQKIIFPDLKTISIKKTEDLKDIKKIVHHYTLIKGMETELPTLGQLKGEDGGLFGFILPPQMRMIKSKNPAISYFSLGALMRNQASFRNLAKPIYKVYAWFACIYNEERYPEQQGKIVLYNPSTDIFKEFNNHLEEVYVAPIHNLKSNRIFNDVLEYSLYPDTSDEHSISLLSDLNLLMLNNYGEKLDNAPFITINKEKILMDAVRNPEDELFDKLNGQWVKNLRNDIQEKRIDYDFIRGQKDMEEAEKNSIKEEKKYTREELLQCEKIRADIEPYEERILTDPNRGHWDLWKDQFEEEYTVITEEKLMARNPECDINDNGVIAIDFGTKSTVVVYQSDIEHSLPMGIGDGNLSKGPTGKRYENPTVMRFVDVNKFYNDYNAKKGRPDTKWNDLNISHTAMEKFSISPSEEYYEYMNQIKQWAGQREKQFRIQPHTGESILLPSFLDLKDDDVNPIEIYAYYIGLYINNMRKGHGIFLDYYLSFPVTYETRIRKKIVESFEKGLKKSLPKSILNNPDIMSRFKVNGDISEPAAYAVCALQEYRLEPEGDEEIFYGIFDFGGGTTDFDFGLWKQSEKRRYDYTIENFGAGGDEFLGGENLLEMLAFEVFKKNQDFMRKNGYTFTLAPKCKEFLGSDALLSDSQEAEKNMHNLMEELRPYWENAEQICQDEKVKKLLINYTEKIREKIIENKHKEEIEKGLNNILSEYEGRGTTAYDSLQKIFLLLNDKGIAPDIAPEEYASLSKNNIDLTEEQEIEVTLFNREGEDHPNEKLKINKDEIDAFIEDKIREGVNNFFSALLLSYQNNKVKKPTVVNILLAGNSCKSPIVRRVFEEEIKKREQQIKEKYDMSKAGKLFEIFPPLGTKEAYEKMRERGIEFDEEDYEKPTGKTGVAFGLIECREGGVIERITSNDIQAEIPFQYFIGWRSKKKFVVFKDEGKITKYKGKPDYNTWYKFIEADAPVFDLFYTTLPECINGDLIVDGNAAVRRHRCTIDTVNDNANVYIRAVDPHTIEYVVASGDDVDNSKLGDIFRKELI